LPDQDNPSPLVCALKHPFRGLRESSRWTRDSWATTHHALNWEFHASYDNMESFTIGIFFLSAMVRLYL